MAEGKAKRMWAMPGAVFVVPQSSLMAGGSDEIIEVPVPSFLIEHPKGLVLYDTGSHPRITEKIRMSTGPSAKFGTERPKSVSTPTA